MIQLKGRNDGYFGWDPNTLNDPGNTSGIAGTQGRWWWYWVGGPKDGTRSLLQDTGFGPQYYKPAPIGPIQGVPADIFGPTGTYGGNWNNGNRPFVQLAAADGANQLVDTSQQNQGGGYVNPPPPAAGGHYVNNSNGDNMNQVNISAILQKKAWDAYGTAIAVPVTTVGGIVAATATLVAALDTAFLLAAIQGGNNDPTTMLLLAGAL